MEGETEIGEGRKGIKKRKRERLLEKWKKNKRKEGKELCEAD